MVNASRDQSQEAPRRLSWAMMVPRLSRFCCQMRASKRFRASAVPCSSIISCLDGSPFAAISRSVTICVAMPAWSVPGCQSVSKPRMRCQRVRTSCRVLLNAWPMWRTPVTLGGGMRTQNVSSRRAPAPAAKAPASSHAA